MCRWLHVFFSSFILASAMQNMQLKRAHCTLHHIDVDVDVDVGVDVDVEFNCIPH